MSVPFIKQFDDYAEAMANPNPDRPIQEAAAAFGRTVCDRISSNPGLFAPTILQSPLVAACTPYWQNQGYSPPEERLPFTGGQCVGTSYSVNGTAIRPGLPNSNFGAGGLFGPLGAVFQRTVAGRVEFVMPNNDASGNPRNTVLFDEDVNRPAATVTITSVTPQFGGPNDCGDPPAEIIPGPTPAPDPGPLPPGTGPTVNVRGAVILVLPGAVQITPTLNVELPIGEINLGSGTGGGPAEDPLPGDELVGEGSGSGGGENDFGDPPDGERWVGCCIRITSAPVGSGVIPSSIPHDVYPIVVGNARLKFQGPGGPVTYDTPIQKRQETSCLWEPVRGMAPIGCFVNLLPGYNYDIQPYSVPLEQ